MYAPEMVTKAHALPFSYELIEVMMLVLKSSSLQGRYGCYPTRV